MRRTLMVIAAMVVAALPAPVGAEVGTVRSGELQQRREPEITQSALVIQPRYFNFKYRRACPSCSEPYATQKIPVATGDVAVKVASYRLKDSPRNKWDFYFVDADYTVTNRKGDEDWGYMYVTVTSVGKTKIFHPAYSEGIGAVNEDSCKSYGLDLSAGIGPVSASVPIALFNSCAKGSSIENDAVPRGRRYKVNKINGVNSVNFRRFVQVRAGTRPKFQVETRWNNESGKVTCGQVSGGSGSGSIRRCWVERGQGYKTVTVGTRG